MEFSRQEYWSGLPFPPPRELPDPGIEPMSPVSPALAGRFFTIAVDAYSSRNQDSYKKLILLSGTISEERLRFGREDGTFRFILKFLANAFNYLS